MRLGLLADPYEAVVPLAAALRELKARRADTFIMLGDVLDAGERIAGFARCSHGRVFIGHQHGRRVFTPARQLGWNGESTFHFQPNQRCLTVVNAVAEGWCALLDTDRDTLEPIRLA